MYTTYDKQAFFGIIFKDHDQNKALNCGVSVTDTGFTMNDQA